MTSIPSESSDRTEPSATGRGRGALGWAGQVLSWFVMLAIGAALLVAFVIPRLAGGSTYVIETGSMRPDLPPGTLIVDKARDAGAVSAGDVITYQLEPNKPEVVTHRVISVGYDGAGQVRWQTQGDANNAPDENWVIADQLRGEVWYAVPYLGNVTALVTNQQRGLMVGLIALGLGGYALAQFRGALKDKRRKQQQEEASVSA